MNRTRIIILIALVFVVFSNTLDNGFVWDDLPLISGNAAVRNPRLALTHFARGFHAAAGGGAGLADGRYWRPIILASFTLDYWIWGNDPFGFHLTNIILHALNSVLFFLLLSGIRKMRPVAFYASLVFALHPLQTNAVAYISGRTDLLAGTFFLLAALAFVRSLGTCPFRSGPFWLALFLMLSLMSKEIALSAPLVLLVIGVLAGIPSPRRYWGAAAVAIGTVVLYLVIRGLLGLPPGGGSSALRGVSLPGLLAAAEGIVLYGLLFAFPVGLHMERFLSLPQAADLPALLCGLAVLLALIASVRSLARGSARGCCLAWFFAALLPASNIVPLYGAIASRQIFLGEQFLYLPLTGLCAGAALLWSDAVAGASGRGRAAMRAAGAAIIILLAILSYRHNEYWRDEMTFYSETLRFYPGSVRMRTNLGLLQARRGNLAEAERHLALVAKSNPRSARACLNLAVVYRREGKMGAARREIRKALGLDPRFVPAYCELGMVSMALGDPAAAAEHYRKALELNPLSMTARVNLAAALLKQGKNEKAIEELRKALELDPRSLEARVLLARALSYMGRDAEAAEQYEVIKRLYPGISVH